MITKREKQEAEKAARTLYQDVLHVDVKEDPEDESSLLITITRGLTLPAVRVERNNLSKLKSVF